ncbi:hypothetical protein [Enterobacter sichuanensis]|uniref:hypothetical protein n=1 Tax=Enterobacter sichuanensis TaxID=2071710 RepID=UPI002DB6E534|nr:hypothetical protein [Enterobacter sichuanensis]
MCAFRARWREQATPLPAELAQLQDTKAELKESREDGRQLMNGPLSRYRPPGVTV